MCMHDADDRIIHLPQIKKFLFSTDCSTSVLDVPIAVLNLFSNNNNIKNITSVYSII